MKLYPLKFENMIDFCDVYKGNAGKVLIVNATETGLVTDTVAGLRDKIITTQAFYLDGVTTLSTTEIARFKVSYSGYLVSLNCVLNTQSTAGTLDLKLNINGTPITPTDLDLQINASYPTSQYKTVAYGTSGFGVSAGDVVTVSATETSMSPDANVVNIETIIES